VPRARLRSLPWRRFPSSTRAEPAPGIAALSARLGAGFRAFLAPEERERWVQGVYAARPTWTGDFGGEQFSLGRAFYTHLEQGKSRDYFAGAEASNVLVERHLPGMQQKMGDLLAWFTGDRVRPRRGWCGPGVHVFPAGEHVSRRGGVVHFDLEGLSEHHLERRLPAITAVASLQAPEAGGGLRLWPLVHEGAPEPTDLARRTRSTRAAFSEGDVVIFDSYRLHQIEPFSGTRDRITLTAHAAWVDEGWWETWF
jgi:hypothetical protein